MSTLPTPELRPSLYTQPKAPFDVYAWLERRAQQSDYVLVEFGHSECPVSAKQDFNDRRLYVGVEAWYYQFPSKDMQKIAFSVASQKPAQNIVFINNPTGRTGYIGETYEPETVLPTGIANEVFLGNVFGDPVIAFNPGRTDLLLSESMRLLRADGKILIRETLTAHYTDVEEKAASFGLKVAARFSLHGDPEIWSRLEELYAPLPHLDQMAGRPPHGNSFYLMLEPISEAVD